MGERNYDPRPDFDSPELKELMATLSPSARENVARARNHLIRVRGYQEAMLEESSKLKATVRTLILRNGVPKATLGRLLKISRTRTRQLLGED